MVSEIRMSYKSLLDLKLSGQFYDAEYSVLFWQLQGEVEIFASYLAKTLSPELEESLGFQG